MKIILHIARFFVGILFIFSGLVKANDPLGLSYKMQEFFDLWGMEAFNHLTLSLSLVIIAFEIIAGVAVLLGWRFRLFSWLLLLLIIFFTFLTGYAYLSGKFKNCGCFGDCIPISAYTSFIKDIILLVLIVGLFINRKKIQPIFSSGLNMALMLTAVLGSIILQWYVLNFLPVFDCLPFKKGNNIAEQLKTPPGAVTDSFAIRFIYEKNGKEFEFSPSELPADFKTYTYKDRIDKLVRKGNAEPPLKGFSLSGETKTDSTQVVLNERYAILLFVEDLSKFSAARQEECRSVFELALKKNLPFYMVTTNIATAKEKLAGTVLANIQVFTCDFTAIRTAARTNPCYYLLSKGTVVNKWSAKTVAGLEFSLMNMKPLIPIPPAGFAGEPDTILSKQDSIH
ncbi:MAG: DoxX family membrane protein [Terrimonas sp.]|nr:DoxX family membrane protein [Terrimonas sp.]